MRFPLLLVGALVLTGSPAGAARPATPNKPVAGRNAKDVGKPMLTAREIMRDVAAYVPEIRDCYLRQAARAPGATGHVSLELVIRPTGAITALHVLAEGVRADRVERCLRDRMGAWRFAEAPGFTTAIVPFLFLRTHAPGAGPTRP